MSVIVAEGKVELLAEEAGRRERVASYVSRGSHFGEGALLTGPPPFLYRPRLDQGAAHRL